MAKAMHDLKTIYRIHTNNEGEIYVCWFVSV